LVREDTNQEKYPICRTFDAGVTTNLNQNENLKTLPFLA